MTTELKGLKIGGNKQTVIIADDVEQKAPEEQKSAFAKAVVPISPKGFRPLTLKRFFDQHGVAIPLTEDGLWVPASEWEYKELQHFQAQGMVELV